MLLKKQHRSVRSKTWQFKVIIMFKNKMQICHIFSGYRSEKLHSQTQLRLHFAVCFVWFVELQLDLPSLVQLSFANETFNSVTSVQLNGVFVFHFSCRTFGTPTARIRVEFFQVAVDLDARPTKSDASNRGRAQFGETEVVNTESSSTRSDWREVVCNVLCRKCGNHRYSLNALRSVGMPNFRAILTENSAFYDTNLYIHGLIIVSKWNSDLPQFAGFSEWSFSRFNFLGFVKLESRTGFEVIRGRSWQCSPACFPEWYVLQSAQLDFESFFRFSLSLILKTCRVSKRFSSDGIQWPNWTVSH